jgi:hypothetical protein
MNKITNKQVVIIYKEKPVTDNPAQQIIIDQIKEKGFLPIEKYGFNEALSYFLTGIQEPPLAVLSEFSVFTFHNMFANRLPYDLKRVATLDDQTTHISRGEHTYTQVKRNDAYHTTTINDKTFPFIDWNKVLKILLPNLNHT